MIEYRQGNIFNSHADVLVNPVNCVGISGKGLALQFKEQFPDNYRFYAASCHEGMLQPGGLLLYPTGRATDPFYIINFPTKRHWRDSSRLGDIEKSLLALRNLIKTRSIKSIAIPALGAGLGGLKWSHVKKAINFALADLSDVRIYVYEPRS